MLSDTVENDAIAEVVGENHELLVVDGVFVWNFRDELWVKLI